MPQGIDIICNAAFKTACVASATIIILMSFPEAPPPEVREVEIIKEVVKAMPGPVIPDGIPIPNVDTKLAIQFKVGKGKVVTFLCPSNVLADPRYITNKNGKMYLSFVREGIEYTIPMDQVNLYNYE